MIGPTNPKNGKFESAVSSLLPLFQKDLISLLFSSRTPANNRESRLHRHIIRWFADEPSSPLSIHRLVQESGSPPGTLFGPAAVCQALLGAMARADEPDLKEVEIYLARDRIICSDVGAN